MWLSGARKRSGATSVSLASRYFWRSASSLLWSNICGLRLPVCGNNSRSTAASASRSRLAADAAPPAPVPRWTAAIRLRYHPCNKGAPKVAAGFTREGFHGGIQADFGGFSCQRAAEFVGRAGRPEISRTGAAADGRPARQAGRLFLLRRLCAASDRDRSWRRQKPRRAERVSDHRDL